MRTGVYLRGGCAWRNNPGKGRKSDNYFSLWFECRLAVIIRNFQDWTGRIDLQCFAFILTHQLISPPFLLLFP